MDKLGKVLNLVGDNIFNSVNYDEIGGCHRTCKFTKGLDMLFVTLVI